MTPGSRTARIFVILIAAMVILGLVASVALPPPVN
jgi:hypothetical protein